MPHQLVDGQPAWYVHPHREPGGRERWTLTPWGAQNLPGTLACLPGRATSVVLRDLPDWPAVGRALSACHDLVSLCVTQCRMDSADARALFGALYRLPRLRRIRRNKDYVTFNQLYLYTEALSSLCHANWNIYYVVPPLRCITDRPPMHGSEYMKSPYTGMPAFLEGPLIAMLPAARLIGQLGRQLGWPAGVEVEILMHFVPVGRVYPARFVAHPDVWLQRCCRLVQLVRDPAFRPQGAGWDQGWLTL